MSDDKKAPPKEQHFLKWLVGIKETPDEQKAREAREKRDKDSRGIIQQAIKGLPVVKEVHDAAKKAQTNNKK